ncbi:MAG: outer membrane protein transport protein [Deltaproteobacteria bacterium]|nr:outer membrane protein transport protein [Deltaproteobacteria bacterium]
MLRPRLSALALVGFFFLANVPTAFATDGHFLHGIGAVNSAMGGAGISAPESLLGTFNLNPAGIMAFDGLRMEFSMEMFQADRTVSSSAPTPGGGTLSGSTQSKKAFVPIPAFGASYRLPGDRVVLGLAGLGTGGFGVDYPASAVPTAPGQSANPILLPQPNGFGQVYSDYSLLKIAASVAWAVTDDLWLGAALNIDRAALAVAPMPAASPDFDPATGTAFFPNATAADGAFGIGFQVGLLYNVNDIFAFGASYTSEQWFRPFEWNSTHANPNLANFGEPRTFSFKLNVPAVVGGGVAVQAVPELLLTADFKYYFYKNTPGFEIPSTGPFNADGSLAGFGWDNIYSIAFGVKYEPADIIALYGGYNFSDNPVPDSLSMINIAAPAIVQHHISVGVGIRATKQFEITAAYYHAFRNSGTGEILNPAIPPGTSSVTNSMQENSVLLQFSYVSRGAI